MINNVNGHFSDDLEYQADTASDEDLNDILSDIGDQHLGTSYDTPLREDAFDLADDEKMEKISAHFKEIMHILGLDLNDDSLAGTPNRVAKMYVKEIFGGLNPANKPVVRSFENKYEYHDMLVEKDITFFSTCEHHFVPIHGKVHVAYIPGDQVVGLSKINRLVQYYAQRPQVQERLTTQIANELKDLLKTDDIAVVIEADHMCVASRGVKDTNSSTTTSMYLGKFKINAIKAEFFRHIDSRV